MFRIPLLPMKNQNASFFICNMEKEVFILKQCGALHDIDTGKKHRTKEEIRRILKY